MIKPLVVGYKGEIGRYILNGLLSYMPKASDILCYDIGSTNKEMIERIEKSDVIFLCVPMVDTMSFFRDYKFLLKNKVVVEQTSLKHWAIKMRAHLKTNLNCELLSMHIGFRPSATPNKQDHTIAVVDYKNPAWVEKDIDGFIEHKSGLYGKVVCFNTITIHDSAMASQQALVHRVLLCLDETLCTEFPTTYISKKVRELASRISSGDCKLYDAIQKNPKLNGRIDEFNKKMREFKFSRYSLGPVTNNAKAK